MDARSGIGVLLAIVAAAASGQELSGTWRTASGSIEVEFGADGRIVLTEEGVRSTGTFEVEGQEIVVALDGAGGPVRYPFERTDGGGLRIRDGRTWIAFERAAPPGAWPPLVHCPFLDENGIQDPATGRPLEAFSMWLPEGYTVRGGVFWRIDYKTIDSIERSDLVDPAFVSLQATSPDGRSALTIYPAAPYTDMSQSLAAAQFPPGSRYGGTTSWPAVGPREFVDGLLMPTYHGPLEARIEDYSPLPGLAELLGQGVAEFNRIAGATGVAAIRFDAGRVQLRYAHEGVAYREDVVVALGYLIMDRMVIWKPHLLWSVRAPVESFEAVAPMLLSCAYSFRLNGLWFLLYQRIVDESWRGVAAVDDTIARIDGEIVASRLKTTSLIHRQLYPVLTGVAMKAADGYAPIPLPTGGNHAVDPQGRVRELPPGQELPPDWKPLEDVPIE